MNQHLLLESLASGFCRALRMIGVGVLGIALLATPEAWGQSPAPLLPPSFLPKSPTLSSLPRFDAQQLVNLPTGAAQLSVPFTDISCGSLHLPVSLAYSYTGLQVYQPKDLVGLGWGLQAGASITLQVNGRLDAATYGDPYRRYSPESIYQPSWAFLRRTLEDGADSGPDVYSFAIPGGPSGRFIIRDTTVVLLPQQPVQVRTFRTTGGFQVATEDGVRYQFQTAEQTRSGGEFGLGNYQSAWHLTRIISADNADTLRLCYSSSTEPTPRRSAMTTGSYSVSFSGAGSEDDGFFECELGRDYHYTNVFATRTQIAVQYLDSIVARGAHVVFERGLEQVLQRVRLIATTGKRHEVKCITLFQSAFSCTNCVGLAGRRLRLDSLRESANGIRLPAYRFTYVDAEMPSRASAAQDYGGYYNGANRNGGDAEYPTGPAMLADPLLGSLKANREPDYQSAISGALIQVTYPTGGYTNWKYESNRIGSQTSPTTVSDTLRPEVRATYDPDNTRIAPGTTSRRVTTSEPYDFTLAEDETLVLDLTRTTQDGNTMRHNLYRDFDLWQRLADGSTVQITGASNLNYRSEYGLARFRFPLPAGQYTVKVYCEDTEECILGLRIPYLVPLTGPDLEGLPSAGVRVNRTETIAPGAPPLVKTYEYVVPDSVRSYSSGVLLAGGPGFAAYNFQNVQNGGGTLGRLGICSWVYTSSDNSQLGDEFIRAPFYYSCVTVRDEVGQGSTVSRFAPLSYFTGEVVLQQLRVYRQNRQRFVLAQQDDYHYNTDSLIVFPLLRVKKTQSVGVFVTTYRDEYVSEQYLLQTGFTYPSRTEQRRYDAQGNEHLTVTQSSYAQQRLVRTATQTSTGWDVQRLKRLSDYVPNALVTALRVNAFNPVIEVQSWHQSPSGTDSVLVGGSITLYDPAWRSPAKAYRLRLNQPVSGPNQETRADGRYTGWLSDTRYEPTGTARYAASSGDLIEQRPTHGPATAYLTGYVQTLVIAQATNATYEQVASTSFEPAATGRWRYDSTSTLHRVAGGRTGYWAYRLDGSAGPSRTGVPAGDYELLCWAQSLTAPTLTLTPSSTVQAWQQVATGPDGWRQYRTRLRFMALGSVTLGPPVGGSVLVDEVRLAPAGARVTSYTHDPLVGETSQTGPDGRTTYFEYDGLGRLVRTRDEQGRILSQQQYHYAGH